MNGPHDAGGQQGWGPVQPEPDVIPFHHDWEKRALALTLASGGMGLWTLDESRHVKERLPPLTYLNASYYERWIAGLELLLVEHGMVTPAELAAGQSLAPPNPKGRRPDAAGFTAALHRGRDFSRPATTPARFAAGDAVTTVNDHPPGHTRLPRYARGRPGRIEIVHGVFVFPDTNAHGQGEQPQWLYTVSFAAADLWGAQADPKTRISTDAWESHLAPA